MLEPSLPSLGDSIASRSVSSAKRCREMVSAFELQPRDGSRCSIDSLGAFEWKQSLFQDPSGFQRPVILDKAF